MGKKNEDKNLEITLERSRTRQQRASTNSCRNIITEVRSLWRRKRIYIPEIIPRQPWKITLTRQFLPKVMQVKNFGRSGRTKYTHLVDQDSTQFDAAWSQDTAQNVKFQVNHAAGMKNVFERPSAKKKK